MDASASTGVSQAPAWGEDQPYAGTAIGSTALLHP
jgi:hypothetical protein